MLDPKTRYSLAEQLILVLVMTAKKLRLYFQTHIIVVLTRQPLKLIFIKPSIFSRIVRWLIKLSEFDLKYCPRTVIKAHTLNNFIVE